MKTILSFLGTRPEAIKMAPVVHALAAEAEAGRIVHRLCHTGQHRDMTAPLLEWFEIEPDYTLDLMTHDQPLAAFTARALSAIDEILDTEKPDLILCQGDTTTAMVAGLAAFYRRIPVGHIEAGLRTGNRFAPFPEEINRRIIDLVADYCFAPTERAAQHLRDEGVAADRILVSGNTAIDALQWTLDKLRETPPPAGLPEAINPCLEASAHRDCVLVTAHRRESIGAGIEAIGDAVGTLAAEMPELRWILPLHPNPRVRESLRHRLGNAPNIILTEPLDYPHLCLLLSRCAFVLTDSGGLQEECPTLGIPVFVLRDTSERPEGIAAGSAVLTGTDPTRIIEAVRRFRDDPGLQEQMRTPRPLYGDGHAAARIAAYCLERLTAPMP